MRRGWQLEHLYSGNSQVELHCSWIRVVKSTDAGTSAGTFRSNVIICSITSDDLPQLLHTVVTNRDPLKVLAAKGAHSRWVLVAHERECKMDLKHEEESCCSLLRYGSGSKLWSWDGSYNNRGEGESSISTAMINRSSSDSEFMLSCSGSAAHDGKGRKFCGSLLKKAPTALGQWARSWRTAFKKHLFSGLTRAQGDLRYQNRRGKEWADGDVGEDRRKKGQAK